MSNFLVQHRWKGEDGEKVVGIVKGVIGMAKNSQLPSGFGLESVNVVAGENRALCAWNAPSADALSDLIRQVNPPTEWSVLEMNRMY